MRSFTSNPTKTPFSRFGSYLSINQLWEWGIGDRKPAGWYLRSVRRSTEVFRIVASRDEDQLPMTAKATAGRLTFEVQGGGTIEFCFVDSQTMRGRIRGCTLTLHALMGDYGNAYSLGQDIHVLTGPSSDHFLCRPLRGRLESSIEWCHYPSRDQAQSVSVRITGDQDGDEIMIHSRVGDPRPPTNLPDFDSSVRQVEAEFDRFLAAFPEVAPVWDEGCRNAAHVLWTSTIETSGILPSPAILMSKNWMTNVWSWDHCFNALGLARAHPELAWQQFMLPFHFQDESGLLPDCVNSIQASWLGTKSPIHGWALRRLMRIGVFTRDHGEMAYAPLSRWAQYWLRERDLDGSGLPYYLHGNEQFDNTTLFQVQAPYRAADLAAYLVILQEVLADLADLLARPGEAAGWRAGAKELLEKIVPALWRDGRFIAPRIGDHFAAEGDCLFRYTALVLGRRLPTEVTRKMISDLSEPGRFRTPFGALASEALTSPLYETDSYVRGPIWAPPNMMIVDGLCELGEIEAANRIRDGFRELCLRNGMHENFHSRTGVGQADPAYTWTAGAFLAWCQD